MSKKARLVSALRRRRNLRIAGLPPRLRVGWFRAVGHLLARIRRKRRSDSAAVVSGGPIPPREAGGRLRPASVDLAQLTLRAGGLRIPFSPLDLVNPEDYDPRAVAWVLLQAGCLRGIVFGGAPARRLADVLRLAGRAGQLPAAHMGIAGQIWVDPLGGVYDLTDVEVFCLPAAAFGAPVAVPCAPNCGDG